MACARFSGDGCVLEFGISIKILASTLTKAVPTKDFTTNYKTQLKQDATQMMMQV